VLENLDTSSSSLSFFCKELEKNSSFVVEGLSEATKSELIFLSQKTTKKNIIVITGGMGEERLYNNLCSLSPFPVIEFPSWETFPGENISPSPDIIGRRLEVLYALTKTKDPIILLTSFQSLLQKTIDIELIPFFFETWKKTTKFIFSEVPSFLSDLGYKRTNVVSDKGEFALRGGIVDVFVTSASAPYRIEFFGDEIDNIRTFDPIGQKSIEKIEEITICPAKEEELIKKEKSSSLILEYLGEDPIFVFDDLVRIEDIYASIKTMITNHYFTSFSNLFDKIKTFSKIYFSEKNLEEISSIKKETKKSIFSEAISFDMFSKKITANRFFHPFITIQDYLNQFMEIPNEFSPIDYIDSFVEKKIPLLFINENKKEEENIREKISKKNITIPDTTKFIKGYLSSGFIVNDIPLAVIPSAEFTKKQKLQRQKWRSTYHTPAAEFHHLEKNDLVVHFHSGIGKYLGIEKQIDHTGKENEFFLVEYSNNSKLFVPISQAHLISRYIGTHEKNPTLSTLGSNRWQKTKLQVQKQIIGYASDLLHLYAHRSMEDGYSYKEDSEELNLFELDFPYVETIDQINAISEIKKDMCSKKPMDRLICGDVGYGKTEVAMRAAFKAVADGKKQVAILVPTTVLALQHYETFSKRMENYPITVSYISRFNSTKENKKAIEATKEGTVDILIGTHRLLSKDISFKNLGLIVIDEEQRFGVRAKEHLKKIKKNVDCLCLSATPIPRTLYLSLIQARDMSVISTPPQDRLPIKTIIAEEDDNVIKNAILRELSRQGQTFVIHNRVDSIFNRAKYIQNLFPKARIGIVHGQMDSTEIDNVFHLFKEGNIDVLIATTIMESGIDVPNANTILIDRSDRFGLADLYQLRGRVGRWNRTAYAYLLIPKNKEPTEISRKRLSSLLESSGYGGGMKIALRDLEIRGAGDILGTKQSGQVSAIGFHLYCKLLKKTIESLKNKQPASFIETKIEFPFDAKIPEEYIPATNLRMEMYYRLGEVSNNQDIENLLEELKDRFGSPPLPILWLYHLTRIKIFASKNQFTLLKLGKLTLIAEQQQGKKLLKKSILLPILSKEPQKLEEIIIDLLEKNFSLY
jgi:transcription-repair coupling factor (superfamily II helicase)